jgi:arabinogalactan oligomer/maltooligosaccharide transport system substrate-binding protein
VKALALLALVACSAPRDPGVVLWHSYIGPERAALEQTAATWNAEHPDKPLVLVAVPHDAFGDKISSAVPRGNGPDLFIYAQDRIGDWADAGVIEPIEFWVDDARAERFSDASLRGMTYGSSLWGLPLAVKSLALFYRTDLVATPPATTDELLQIHVPDGFALAYANIDLYGHAPWLHGFGGRVLDDDGKLVVDSREAAAAMDFAAMLVRDKIVPNDAQNNDAASLFNGGKAAMVMLGPWAIPDIHDDVPWRVAPLPIVSATGKPAAPFLGSEGILMSARAHDKDAAFAVMDALTGDAAAIVRARARQVVANPHAYDDPEVARDPVLHAFREQLQHTVAMPNNPAMRMVWNPYRTAIGDVVGGRKEAAPRLHDLQQQLEGYQR